jgi:predicted aspartyl protease
MNFEQKQDLIWVPIEVVYEGKHIIIPDCIIDTGSSSTMIDIDLVEFNYKKPAIIKRLFGIGTGKQEVLSQKVDKIIIEQFKLEAVEIEFGTIKENLGINGFIGNDILSKFIVSIDFNQQVINLKLNQ